MRPESKRNRARPATKSDRSEPSHPEDFGKKTSPVRERLARQMKDMSPSERIKKGP